MRSLFAFPNPVNEVSARLVAGGVVVMTALVLTLGWHWLLIPLAYGFVARVLTGPTLSPLGQVVTRGQVIGSTGHGHPDAAQPHLHFGAKVGSTYIDPMTLLEPGSVVPGAGLIITAFVFPAGAV